MSVSASSDWLRYHRSCRWRVALAALLCLGPVFSLRAQDAPGGQVGAPTPLLPPAAPASPAPLSPAPLSPAPAAPQGFEVDELGAARLDYAGTLESGEGGLGAEMWRGTDRIEVERLLPLLRPILSPALFDLSRRLLLSAAAPPRGQGSGQGNAKSLFVPRAQALARMGLVQDAVALLRLMPAERRDASSGRLLVELALRAGDADAACAEARARVTQVQVDRFWQEATIFCQLRAGETAQASLGLDLLREAQGEDDAFLALAAHLAGTGKPEIPPLPLVEPLYLAMVQAAGLPFPKLAIDPPPAMQALIAESAAAEPARRLAAGEAAARFGLLPPRRLAEIYAAQPAEAAELDAARDRPDAGGTPRDRALLYQAAKRAADPQARLSLAAKAVTGPVSDPAYWLQLRLYAPLLAELAPAPALAPQAAAAARILYADGRFKAARGWLALLQGNATTIADSGATLPALQALDYIAGGPQAAPLIGPILEARRNQGAELGQSGSDRQAARLRAILDAFEESPGSPASDADGALTAAANATVELPQSNRNLWLDLGDAAAKGRVGEAALLSLVGLEASGPGGAEALWLTRVIDSLRRVGLEGDARRIAVEAAIANGL